MDKQVKSIRESIKQRKKTRHHVRQADWHTLPYLATEEEKHGINVETNLHDTVTHPASGEKIKGAFIKKMLGSILLFSVLFIVLKMNVSMFATPKNWIEAAFQEEFPFAKISESYIEHFGSPLALTPEAVETAITNKGDIDLPISGELVETFAANGSGIKIVSDETANVTAVDGGTVIFAGNDRKTNKTVIIQHADKSKTIYGQLSSIDVFLYEYVQAHEKIGAYNPATNKEPIYFSMMKEAEYIDPTEVILHVDAP